MNTGKADYTYKFQTGYCAGAFNRAYCEENDLATGGTELGIGHGRTLAQAKRRAKDNKVIIGNIDLECVLHHELVFYKGKKIQESY